MRESELLRAPLTQSVTSDRLDDVALRRVLTATRWGLAIVYAVLGIAGFLDVPANLLASSVGALVVSNAVFTWQQVAVRKPRQPALAALRWSDVTLVALVLVALHDVRSPVWGLYFLTIATSARLIDRREMVLFIGWIAANYLGAAVAIAGLGHGVPWAYATVVTFGLVFAGTNAMMLAKGEQRLRAIISELAVTDALTGLPNRRQFHRMYTSTLDEAIDSRTPLALMLIDVDHFKQINDEQGHPVGDDRLRDIAACMRSVARRDDLVARFGGDEFIVVAPQSTRDEARVLAERLRTAVVNSGTSVSIGVAIFPEDAQREDALIAAADAALYSAKQAGRNCVREAA